MKITNKFGLPETIVNVVRRPTYTKGGAHLSVTELMTSPRIVQLRAANLDKIEQDVSDFVWSLFGTAIHGVLEHGKVDNHIVEERIHAHLDGYNISGAIDLQTVDPDGITISDYKTTGAWSVMNEKKDWETQLNIYAWLVETVKKKPVKAIEIVAIIRDWSRREAQTRDGYPQAPIVTLQIPMWDLSYTEQYIRDRIHAHADAHLSLLTNGELPQCTPEDMWEKPAVWAIKKEGNVRAKTLCSTEEEAKQKLAELGKGYAIEHRPGERTRCMNYCAVSEFCTQWAEFRREQ
jgi:hypothetical protein